MTDIKVAYIVERKNHLKMFYSLSKTEGMDKRIYIPCGTNCDNYHSNVDIYTYKNEENLKNYLEKFSPKICIQTRTNSGLHGFLKSRKVKLAFMDHGVLVDCDSVRKNLRGARGIYSNYDYCFVLTESIDKIMLNKYALVSNDKIYTNCISQFDYLKQIRDCKKGENKFTILLVGALCSSDPERAMKTKSDYVDNKDYYDAIFIIYDMVVRNNWRLIIKPRSNDGFDFLKKSIKRISWASDFLSKYSNIVKDYENVTLADSEQDIYEVFKKIDLVVCNGWTTAEIETCLLKKPLIVFSTKKEKEGDFYKTVKCGAAQFVCDVKDLGTKILYCIDNCENIRHKQEKCMSDELGIVFDGKSNKRVDEIIKLNL